MRASRSFCLALALALAIAPLRTAMAQPEAEPYEPSEPPVAVMARDRFDRGRAALKAGDPEAALALFAESHRLYPTSSALLNRAAVEEQLGRLVEAWEHFATALERLPASDDRVAFVRERLTAIGARIGLLRIDLAGGAARAAVSLDGAELARERLGRLIPVTPGPHEIVASAPGRRAERITVEVAAGVTKLLVMSPGAPEAGPPPPRVPAEAPLEPLAPPAPRARDAGWVLGGVGLALVSLGAITSALALAKQNEIETLCSDEPARCLDDGRALAEDGQLFAAVGTATLAAGVVAAGTSAYLFAASAGASSAADDRRAQEVAALVVGGAGVAALVVGGVTGALAAAKHGELDERCPEPSRCDAEGVGLALDGRMLALASATAIGSGLAAVGGGLLLWATASSGSADHGLLVAPRADGGLAAVQGRF
jgi:tetratricopeptide (TPR) repeat protein